MKRECEEAEVMVICFEEEDIISTSGLMTNCQVVENTTGEVCIVVTQQ